MPGISWQLKQPSRRIASAARLGSPVVIAALFAALLRRRAVVLPPGAPVLDQDTPAERRLDLLLKIGTGVTVAILLVFTVASYSVGTTLFAPTNDALDIELRGHRWWW